MLRERVVPSGGDMLNGHFVPGGVNVGINMTGSLLDQVFGPDPDVYRPERWLLSEESSHLTQMERVYELVFGYGATKCMGIPLAAMTMNKGLVEVFFRASFKFAQIGGD